MLFPSEPALHVTPCLALPEPLRDEGPTYRLAAVSDAAVEIGARETHLVDVTRSVALIDLLCCEFWLGVEQVLKILRVNRFC